MARLTDDRHDELDLLPRREGLLYHYCLYTMSDQALLFSLQEIPHIMRRQGLPTQVPGGGSQITASKGRTQSASTLQLGVAGLVGPGMHTARASAASASSWHRRWRHLPPGPPSGSSCVSSTATLRRNVAVSSALDAVSP